MVPSQVVQTGQDDQTAEMRPVTVGPRVDQEMVIEKGLEPGETVVVDGQLRLANGSRVQVRRAGNGGPSRSSEGGPSGDLKGAPGGGGPRH